MSSKQSSARPTLLLLGVFLLLWMIGLALGEPVRVLEQAKSICLECIGIG